MKKFFTTLFIFLSLLFNINIISTFAQPKSFSQGFYSLNNLNLMENVNYTVQNISSNYSAYLIIFDDKDRTQESVRLEPSSPKHILLPIKSNYNILIIGKGELTFY